jgi:hypothetical protein
MTNSPSKGANIKNKFPEWRISGEVEEQNRRCRGRSNGVNGFSEGKGKGVNMWN